jgi:hypothetical protein
MHNKSDCTTPVPETTTQGWNPTSFYRDILHNLDPTIEEDMAIYKDTRFTYMSEREGMRKKVYLDTQGHPTIGIGFNMNAEGARETWKKVFHKKIDFDEAKVGKVELTKEQVMKLFNESIKERENYLKKDSMYGKIFNKLRLNERLALEDLYFQGGNTVIGIKGKFRQYLHDYYKDGKEENLRMAIGEIKKSITKFSRTRKEGQIDLLT